VELSGENGLGLPFKKIRIIPLKYYPGKLNMAVDYFFCRHIQNYQEPVFRFYGWRPYCLSIGYHQDAGKIKLKKLFSDGYDLVRRPTGGSAIFHSQELTYSIVIPKKMMHHKQLYGTVHHILFNVLRKLGYDVSLHAENDRLNYLKSGSATFICFNRSAYTEIKANNRKLVGSAQKIFTDAILQHGSILIGKEQNKILDYFDDDRETFEYNRKYLLDNSVSLNEMGDDVITAESLSGHIITHLERATNIYIKPLTDTELEDAKNYFGEFEIKN